MLEVLVTLIVMPLVLILGVRSLPEGSEVELTLGPLKFRAARSPSSGRRHA